MIVRDVKKEELSFVRNQRLEAYQEHVQNLPESHWNALKKGLVSEADQKPGVELIAAEQDGKILGSVVLFPANIHAYGRLLEKQDYPEIRLLAVAPSERGRGVASALVKECISRARAHGYSFIGLHTGEFMKDAISLYERMGFVHIPALDFEPGNDGIIVKGYRLGI